MLGSGQGCRGAEPATIDGDSLRAVRSLTVHCLGQDLGPLRTRWIAAQDPAHDPYTLDAQSFPCAVIVNASTIDATPVTYPGDVLLSS